jgi:hypothetical protein
MANKIIHDDNPTFDPVNNPSHYCEGRAYEPIDVINDWELGFDLGNVVKYISRAGRKNNALEDLKKARFYLNHQINMLELDEDENEAIEGRMDVEMGHRSEQIIYGHNIANNKDWIEINGKKFEEV